jgi:hypothetical protein
MEMNRMYLVEEPCMMKSVSGFDRRRSASSGTSQNEYHSPFPDHRRRGKTATAK